MRVTGQKSIFSIFSSFVTQEGSTKKPEAEMRPLSEEELRAVAGGPECEVGMGT